MQKQILNKKDKINEIIINLKKYLQKNEEIIDFDFIKKFFNYISFDETNIYLFMEIDKYLLKIYLNNEILFKHNKKLRDILVLISKLNSNNSEEIISNLFLIKNDTKEVNLLEIIKKEQLNTEMKENKEEKINLEKNENILYVKKRNGEVVPFDINKIYKTHLNYAFQKIKENIYVKKTFFEDFLKENLKPNTSTEKITQMILNYAIDKISPEAQEYNLIAARILIKDLEHQVYHNWNLKPYSKEFYDKFKEKEHFKSYKDYIAKGYIEYLTFAIKKTEEPIFTEILLEKFNKETLYNIAKNIDPKRDLIFKYIGIKTLYDRYLKRYKDKLFELPQWRYMTVALFLASNEKFNGLFYYKNKNNKYQLTYYSNLILNKLLNKNSEKIEFDTVEEVKKFIKEKNRELYKKYKNKEKLTQKIKEIYAIEFYNIISEHYAMLATPTLNNAGTINHQLSSCFQSKVPDNIEGIMDELKEAAIESKFGGGIGKEFLLRGTNQPINGKSNVSKNVVMWLKLENNLMLVVDQLGTRPGNEAAYIPVWHPDIKEFIEMKRKGGEDRLRAYDLFNGITFPKIFFDVLEGKVLLNNEKYAWYLISPYYSKIYKKNGMYKDLLNDTWGKEFDKNYLKLVNDPNIPKIKVNALEVFKLFINTAYKDGSPFAIFRFNHNKSHQLKLGPVTASNLCTEMSQYTKENIYGVRFILEKLKQEEINDLNKEIDLLISKYKTKIIFDTVNIGGNKEYYVLIPEYLKINNGEEYKYAKNFTVFDKLFGKFNIKYIDKDLLKLGHNVVCNLASINVNIPKNLRKHVSKIVIRMLDNVIDLNKYPTYKTRNSALNTRAIGIGKMNLYQYIVGNKKIEWDTQEAREEIAKLMFDFSYNEIMASIELSIEKGKPYFYKYSKWKDGICYWDNKIDDLKLVIKNKNLINDYIEKSKFLGLLSKKYGIRNIYIQAIAPTGSISLITDCTPSVEGIYKKSWNEENSSGLIPVIAPGLSVETWNLYKSVYDYNPLALLKNTAVIQCFVDQAISYNIYFDNNKKYKLFGEDIDIENIIVYTYLLAHKLGIKSIYYLRSQTPSNNQDNDVIDRKFECVNCQ